MEIAKISSVAEFYYFFLYISDGHYRKVLHYISIKLNYIFLRLTSKHISDSTNTLLCVLLEQHAKIVGYSIEVNIGLLKY